MSIQKFKLTLTFFLIGLMVLTGCSTKTNGGMDDNSTSEIDPDGFEQRLVELQQKIDSVAAYLQQAEGLAESAGHIDLQVARYFADYIEWELEHPDLITEALAANDFFDAQETLTPAQREQRYIEHIDRELTGAMAVLDDAMQRLEVDDFRPGLEP